MASEQLDSLLSDKVRADFQLIKDTAPQIKAAVDAVVAGNEKIAASEGKRAASTKGLGDKVATLTKAEKEHAKVVEALTYATSEEAKQIAILQKELNDARKANRDYAQSVKETTDAYKKLDNEHKKLEGQARKLGALYGAQSKQFLEAAESANEYGNKLREIDAKLGNYRRNVGNYASGWNGLGMSIAQLTREMPAFANSMQTGLMAISNNLPILADEIKKVKVQNAELMAQGKASVSVWKQIGAAIISWQTALSVGITLLTVFGPKIWDWLMDTATAAKHAAIANLNLKNSIDKLTDAYKYLNGEIDRTERLLLAQAKAAGKSEEEITAIEKKAIQERIDLKNKEIDQLIEQRGALEKSLQFQMASRQFTEKDIKETVGLIEKATKAKLDAEEERSNLYTDLQVKDYDLQNTLRIKREREEAKELKTSIREYESYAKKRLKILEAFEQARKILSAKFRAAPSDEEFNDTASSLSRKSDSDIVLAVRFKVKEEQLQKDLQEIDNILNEKLTAIHDRYNRGGYKNHEDYQKELTKVAAEYALKRLKLQIDAFDRELALLSPTEEKYAEFYAKLTKMKEDYAKGVAGQKKGSSDDSSASQKKDLEEIISIVQSAQATANELAQIGDMYYQKKISALEREGQLIDRNLALEISAIKASTREGEERDKKIHAAEVRADGERRKRDAEILKQKARQARFDRAVAIGNIIINTALAVVKALPAIPLAIAAGAFGAAQLAVALATPLPQYAEGTHNHPGGRALIGEGGEKELVQEPGGRTYLVDKPQIKHLPAGTRVIPEHDLIAAGMGMLTPQLVSKLANKDVSGFPLSEPDMDKFAKKIGRAVSHSSKNTTIIQGIDVYKLKHVKGRA